MVDNGIQERIDNYVAWLKVYDDELQSRRAVRIPPSVSVDLDGTRFEQRRYLLGNWTFSLSPIGSDLCLTVTAVFTPRPEGAAVPVREPLTVAPPHQPGVAEAMIRHWIGETLKLA